MMPHREHIYAAIMGAHCLHTIITRNAIPYCVSFLGVFVYQYASLNHEHALMYMVYKERERVLLKSLYFGFD